MHPRVLILLPLVVSAAAVEKVTYDDHVLPIFQQACLNCHNPDKAKGGLDLSTFSGAMKGGSGGKIAEPGDTGSRLIAVVTHTAEPVMPPEGDRLGGDAVDVLKAWIEGGLLENKSSSARKPTKPKFDASLKSSTDKPEGPPPVPHDVLLDPVVVAHRASSVHAMAASPWAPVLAVTGQKQVLLFNTDTLEICGVLPFPEGDPVSLAFTPNARYLIVGGGVPGKSGVTVTFDVVTGERMLVAAKEFDSVLAADLKPDLSMVATGSTSRLIKLWKSEDGSQLHSIKKHTEWVTAVDFSPDGILLATGDRNGGVWVWEADSANEFHTLRAHQAAISALAFRADSNLVATASEDGSVRFWEMNGGSEVKKIDAHPGGVLSFAWARDGSFVTSGRDRVVKLWKPDFNLLREFKDQPDLPVAVSFDSEGKRVFAANYHGAISAWDVASGEAVGAFDANPPSVARRLELVSADLNQKTTSIFAAEAAVSAATAALEEARGVASAGEAKIAESKAAAEKAAAELQDAEGKLGELQPKLAGMRSAKEELITKAEEIHREMASRREAVTASDAAIATAVASQEAAATAQRLAEEAVGKAREQNQGDLSALEADATAKRQAAEAATANLDRARSDRGREQGALDEAANRHKIATDELTRLTGEIDRSTAEADSLAKLIAARKALRDAAVQAQQAAEAGLPGAKDAVAAREKALADATQALAAEQKAKESLQLNEQRWKTADALTEYLRARDEAAGLRAEVENLRGEADPAAQTEIASRKAAADAAAAKAEELKSRYQALRSPAPTAAASPAP